MIYAGWDGYIDTPTGHNAISARGGNDIIWVTGPQNDPKDVRVDCGKGNDTVYYDLKGDTLKHYETMRQEWWEAH